jgi:hypothetical protein
MLILTRVKRRGGGLEESDFQQPNIEIEGQNRGQDKGTLFEVLVLGICT